MSWPQCCGKPTIGVERQGWYDGVAYFECEVCGESHRRGEGIERFDKLWERRLAELPFVSRPKVATELSALRAELTEEGGKDG